jgi:hypothetical protein
MTPSDPSRSDPFGADARAARNAALMRHYKVILDITQSAEGLVDHLNDDRFTLVMLVYLQAARGDLQSGFERLMAENPEIGRQL